MRKVIPEGSPRSVLDNESFVDTLVTRLVSGRINVETLEETVINVSDRFEIEKMAACEILKSQGLTEFLSFKQTFNLPDSLLSEPLVLSAARRLLRLSNSPTYFLKVLYFFGLEKIFTDQRTEAFFRKKSADFVLVAFSKHSFGLGIKLLDLSREEKKDFFEKNIEEMKTIFSNWICTGRFESVRKAKSFFDISDVEMTNIFQQKIEVEKQARIKAALEFAKYFDLLALFFVFDKKLSAGSCFSDRVKAKEVLDFLIERELFLTAEDFLRCAVLSGLITEEAKAGRYSLVENKAKAEKERRENRQKRNWVDVYDKEKKFEVVDKILKFYVYQYVLSLLPTDRQMVYWTQHGLNLGFASNLKISELSREASQYTKEQILSWLLPLGFLTTFEEVGIINPPQRDFFCLEETEESEVFLSFRTDEEIRLFLDRAADLFNQSTTFNKNRDLEPVGLEAEQDSIGGRKWGKIAAVLEKCWLFKEGEEFKDADRLLQVQHNTGYLFSSLLGIQDGQDLRWLQDFNFGNSKIKNWLDFLDSFCPGKPELIKELKAIIKEGLAIRKKINDFLSKNPNLEDWFFASELKNQDTQRIVSTDNSL